MSVRLSECERLFLNAGQFYHLCTSPLEVDIYFKTKEGMNEALNIVAFAVFFSGCRLLAFAIMSNHFHFVLEGSLEMCEAFFKEFHQRLSVLLAGDNRQKLAKECVPKYIRINNLRQLKDEIAYVVRNPFVANPNVNMFHYRWCSGYLYFNDDLPSQPQGKCVAEMSLTKRRSFSHTRTGEVDSRIMAEDGVACATCFVDYKRAEAFFENARDYQHCLLKNVESQVEIAKRIGDKVALDDHDMWDVVCRQCRTAYKVSGPKDLSPEDRISLARQLKFEYNASNAQISRCLGILRNAVDQIFPLSSR